MYVDLTQFNEKYFDIKLIDGTVINVPKPTQEMYIKLLNLKDVKISANLVNETKDLAFKILIQNIEKHRIDRKKAIPTIEVAMAIIDGYAKFIEDVINHPN